MGYPPMPSIKVQRKSLHALQSASFGGATCSDLLYGLVWDSSPKHPLLHEEKMQQEAQQLA